MGVWYRIGQFWQLLRTTPLPEKAMAEITAVLCPAELSLFQRFGSGDQWHSYRVYCTLRDAGHTQPDLLVAALLHDVGKTRVPLTIWERSLIVLVQLGLPSRLAEWGTGNPEGWKRPFVVKEQHPAWSAEMASRAGTNRLAVSLIRKHQDRLPRTVETEEARLLRLLQWADDQN